MRKFLLGRVLAHYDGALENNWGNFMDAGKALIEHMYREMRIDDEWAVKEDRGFTWWGGSLAQRSGPKSQLTISTFKSAGFTRGRPF